MSKKKFTTTIDDKLITRMKVEALSRKKSVATIIEELFNKYFEDKKLARKTRTVKKI